MAKQARVLNEAEIKRVIAVAKTTRHAQRNTLMVMLSFYAGLRAVEIANLLISDVIDGDGTVKQQIYLKREQTKGKEAQVVYFNEKLRKAIAQYLKSYSYHSARLLGSQKIESEGFSSVAIQNIFRKLYKDAGIANASSHSGRRTMITKLAEKGVAVPVIQKLARHSSLQTTQRYIETSSDKLAAAVELI